MQTSLFQWKLFAYTFRINIASSLSEMSIIIKYLFDFVVSRQI